MNKSIQLIINRINKKSTVINTNLYMSIYSIKCIISNNFNIPIKDIYLEYRSKKLNNDRSLKHYNIYDKSIIMMKVGSVKGGIEYTTIIYYIYILLAIIAIIVFTLFMVSGFNVVFSQVYKIVVTKCLSSIYNILTANYNEAPPGQLYASDLNSSTLGKLSDEIGGGLSSIFSTFLHYFGIILEYGSLYFFNYIGTALCFFPILYLINNNLCSSTYIADKIGFYVTMCFLFIYGIYRGPRIFISGANSIIKRNPILAFFSPLLSATKRLSSHITFDPIYAIPIVGQIIAAYHTAVSIFINFINYGASYVRGIGVTCDGIINNNNFNMSESIDKILPLFCYILVLDMTMKKLNNRNVDITKIHNDKNITDLDPTQQKIFKLKLEDQQQLLDNANNYIDNLTYYSTSSVAPIIRDWHAERYIPLFKYSLLALIGSPLNNRINEIEMEIKHMVNNNNTDLDVQKHNMYNDLRKNADDIIGKVYNLNSGSSIPVMNKDGTIIHKDLTDIEVGNKVTKREFLLNIANLWITMKERYNTASYFQRVNDPELFDVMLSNVGYHTLCGALDAIQSIADIIIESGNPFDLVDMICSANLSGIVSSIAIVVFLIVILVYHFFGWKLFGKNI
jgi:hypothetical protein